MALCFIASRGLLPAPINAPARHAQTLSGCLPRIVVDEVQELQQRLDVLSIELGKGATSNGPHPRSEGPSIPLKDPSKAPSQVLTADAERLPMDQLRAALKEALQENDQLRRELLTEQQRRQVAITALTSQPA
ncbi:hypothetical protein COCSUDRAFT_54954 [Coccomyxa subellipsoidea C-169]|uniref:Uncharacterized protein n=1 Tax=Coccomyxa subellipsoidea (strain C-169) TaxID=574566 RepID=I0YIZ0_COCSC|nr:hypothetical protein COCSUDRAFT_54954 [Coccomyxa subellipsoidea C-169]EIE18359.1 hypothetical protein COCSUDRAFT_54954 [Coccomyxa subellipsoidea C-169]|eukprot:XP_005642903.1 hypothetical protein COCSUDRAFT_54954 [Coccomyxa subellipsoidea C-169]